LRDGFRVEQGYRGVPFKPGHVREEFDEVLLEDNIGALLGYELPELLFHEFFLLHSEFLVLVEAELLTLNGLHDNVFDGLVFRVLVRAADAEFLFLFFPLDPLFVGIQVGRLCGGSGKSARAVELWTASLYSCEVVEYERQHIVDPKCILVAHSIFEATVDDFHTDGLYLVFLRVEQFDDNSELVDFFMGFDDVEVLDDVLKLGRLLQ